jgi:hypothetical protein
MLNVGFSFKKSSSRGQKDGSAEVQQEEENVGWPWPTPRRQTARNAAALAGADLS